MHLLEYPESDLLRLEGRFDAFAAPAVAEALERLARPKTSLVVDIGGVDFIDSTGLATLIQSMKRQRQADGDLILRSPSDAVRVIFELTKLDRAFVIEP